MKRKNILESDLNQSVDDLYSLYSDMYKERYNIRPRWIKPSELSQEELQSMIDDLQDTPWDDDDREQYQFVDDTHEDNRFYTDLDNAELDAASMRIAAREPHHPFEDLPSHAGMGFGRRGRNKIHETETDEVAPPGGEKLVKALKKDKKVKNPWAVAWSKYNKGELDESSKITIKELRTIIKEELLKIK
jgi:hypothetical protein